MISTPLVIPDFEQKDARAKTFHLLKKWTSLTFLAQAVELYRQFLYAYEKQLDHPSKNQKELESWYLECFLPKLIELELGENILRIGVDKRAAFRALIEGAKFSDFLFGRAAYEWGVAHDPFFQSLGAREIRFGNSDIATGYVKRALLAFRCFEALKCTGQFEFSYRLSFGKSEDGGGREFEHWTYESLFQESPSPGWPNWPPGRSYPENLPPCPPKNESSAGEVYSGQEIPIEGIWEPWFPTGKVGCPNYFLRGSVAHKYQLEGTNEEVIVRWRLLWEDNRYLDGSVPAEEEAYLEKPLQVQTRFRALPGEPCPRTGSWHSFAAQKTVHVEAGKPMPGPERTSIGAVIWQFRTPHTE